MTASPEALLERRHKAGRADRWSGIVLALLMLAALGLAARHIWTIATGPLPPGPGVAAPAFNGSTVDGEPFELGSLQGKVVLLDFWATWCPPCVATMPHLQKLQDELGAKGLVVIGVNQEPGEELKVKRFLTKRNLSFRSVMDPGSIHVGYGVFSFPTSFVIDRQGIIRASFRGPASEGQLRRAIEDVL
jgi:thiol-disulfide isomerase/thioredoxin